MELSVSWTAFAEMKLQEIYVFHKEKNAKIIIDNIIDKTIILISFPEMGQIEKILIHRPENFRYLVENNYKIIYWVDNDKKLIIIANVFNCTQEELKILNFQ